MSFRKVIGAAAALFFVSSLPAASETSFAFDPVAGVFRAAPVVGEAGAQRAQVARTGKFEITIRTTLQYPNPSTQRPLCTATVGHFGMTGISYQEIATIGSSGSGTAWTCRLILPYSWAQAETSAPVQISIMVASGAEIAAKSRNHFRILPPRALPADNATTRLSFDVVL